MNNGDLIAFVVIWGVIAAVVAFTVAALAGREDNDDNDNDNVEEA